MSAGPVIGVDPGRSKAGYALLDPAGGVLSAGIETIDRLPECLAAWTITRPKA